jgi:hypothetical protein
MLPRFLLRIFLGNVSCPSITHLSLVVRLSIGLEDKDDIIADLEQGLAAA